MGYKAKQKAEKKHRRRILETIIGTDLLTAREKWAAGTIGGLYKLTNESAYVKNSDDKPSMSVAEFERYLKENIHENFRVYYNADINPAHKVTGHQVAFYIDAWEAVIPICKVGRSADITIPAHSQGKVVLYKGKNYKNNGFFDEEPILWRGWVAAYEACKAAYEDWDRNGVEPSRAVSADEYRALKQVYDIVGFKEQVDNYVTKLQSDIVVENQIQEALDKETIPTEEIKEVPKENTEVETNGSKDLTTD